MWGAISRMGEELQELANREDNSESEDEEQEVATEEATKWVVGPALASNMSLSWRTSPTQEVLELSPEVEVSPSSGIIGAGVTTKPLTKSPTLQVLVLLLSNWALLQISLVKKEYPGISEKCLIQGVKIISPNVRESGFPNPGNFCFWNPESGKILLLESGILGFGIWKTAQGSRNPLRIGIQNPSSTDKDWNPVPGLQNPRSGIQDLRLSWIPLHRPKIRSRHPDKCPASLLRT